MAENGHADAGCHNPFFTIEGKHQGILGSTAELIGWTPLVEAKNIAKKEGALARIVAKLECYQPACSIKDRIALNMVVDAEKRGVLIPGVTTILEPTSGNTGIALAMVGRLKGYKVITVMPRGRSLEKRMMMHALGAEVILVEGGFTATCKKADELVSSIPNAVILDQNRNHANPTAHYVSTGPEIWKATEGKVDILVSGCGTGGTATGTGRYLKEMNPGVHVVGVEPVESPILSGGEDGCHGIQGVGPGFIPDVTDTSVLDEIVTVSTEEAYEYTLKLIKDEGMLVGISSGAAFAAAMKIAKLEKNRDKLIVAIFPSGTERYLTAPLFASMRKTCEDLPVLPAPDY